MQAAKRWLGSNPSSIALRGAALLAAIAGFESPGRTACRLISRLSEVHHSMPACKAALSSYPCLWLASAALMLGFESPVRLRQWIRLGKPTTIASIIGSYQCEHVRSRPISETKHVWANSVLRSGTTRESLVIYVFATAWSPADHLNDRGI